MKNKTLGSPNYFLFIGEKNPDKSDFLSFALLMRKYKPSRNKSLFAEMAVC